MTINRLIHHVSIATWRIRHKLRRYREAIAYARGRMDMSVANDIICKCQAAAEWYPLEVLCVDSCLQTALCHWQDHPELESLVQSACATVASKWESSGHQSDTAQDWALDLIGEYAEARGIQPARVEDEVPASADPNEKQPAPAPP